MNRIYLKTTACGPLGSYLGAREYEVPGAMPVEFAEQLVKGGAAEDRSPTPAPAALPVVEAATVEAPENAAVRTEAPRKRRPRG